MELSTDAYPAEAILKAAATAFEGFAFHLRERDGGVPPHNLVVMTNVSNEVVDDRIASRVRVFWSELHRQTVRFLVADRTANIRNLLVGRALYHTCLDVEGPKDDGKGIVGRTD